MGHPSDVTACHLQPRGSVLVERKHNVGQRRQRKRRLVGSFGPQNHEKCRFRKVELWVNEGCGLPWFSIRSIESGLCQKTKRLTIVKSFRDLSGM